ncbi:Domain of Kin17 curved DNA-binding family protein [Babesia bovis T2Bo]|uniref:DNA/RNA-binding protein Kin17 WH-like domain-containing protein n=1 Tax=Babesia bovis TaxID=5865 RepID=A7AV57_BABBO|nr:Domain of Kin17 curved DNA-binding family protein [Babesia bovis T2Bo]EDO05683.1 Domain of Kin17 curved DNA-binding family protein [Babesia bovis T2Bo]|eukprot:XP_001609251.1 hypothetical protein [Babesia bovis T2Bo]
MPRAEVGSQKWLANKMKAKGLQKLKWYCQMCEKQCRDENGFKCHRLSEGHQRMMQVFCQNAGRFMDGFSRAFEHEFMKLMRTRYCKTKILANSVYQEVISDKEHVHMNATVWVTLSEFVLYLGRSGKCKVEDSPRGWMIEYIDQDQIRRDQDAASRRKREISLEQRHQRLIQKMVEEARARGGFQEPEYTPLMKDSDEKLCFDTNLVKSNSEPAPKNSGNIFKALCKSAISSKDPKKDASKGLGEATNNHASTEMSSETSADGSKNCQVTSVANSDSSSGVKNAPPKRKSAIEELFEERFMKRHANGRGNTPAVVPPKDADSASGNNSWLMRGIHVKVILKSHPLYKHKCRVMNVVNGGRQAVIQDVQGSSNYQIDVDHIETVVPPVGANVVLLRGPNRGRTGKLISSTPSDLQASISLDSGETLEMVHYDDFSRCD